MKPTPTLAFAAAIGLAACTPALQTPDRQESTRTRLDTDYPSTVRYVEVAGDIATVLLPTAPADAAETCRPAVVWMHGYGSNGFLDEGDQRLADTGVILIGIHGTDTLNEGDSYRWSVVGFEQSHRSIQVGLSKVATSHCIDRDRVYLMGFSQGSLHAGALLAQHPDAYAGALLISPGGRQPVPTSSHARHKRVVVINGQQEHPHNLEMAEAFRALFAAGNEVQSQVHEGGHTFPADWHRSLPAALNWLRKDEHSGQTDQTGTHVSDIDS